MDHKTGGSGGPRQTGAALKKAYQFVVWLVPTVERFPRAQKFLLGDRLQGTALEVLEGLVEATYSRDASAALQRVNPCLPRLCLLERIAPDHFAKQQNPFVRCLGRRQPLRTQNPFARCFSC